MDERVARTVSNKNTVVENVAKYFLLAADILLLVIFTALNPRFASVMNLSDIIGQASMIGIMGIGATIIMMVGEMNFGIGAEATVTAALLGYMLGNGRMNLYVLGLLIALTVICVIGYLNAVFGVMLGVPAFIATLALSKIWDGATSWLTDNKTMYDSSWPKVFTFLGQYRIFGVFPMTAVCFIVVAVIAWFIIDKTKLGEQIQAVGNNAKCCRQVGINVRRVKIIAFILCSLIAGFSGIVASSKTGNVVNTLGSSLMMNSMAAAMMGATFLRPGRYNIQGTVVAALLTAIIKNGIKFNGYPDAIQNIVNGVILLVAVGYIAMTRKEGLPSVKMG